MNNNKYTTFIAEISIHKLLEISVPNDFISPTNMEMNSNSDVQKFIAEHLAQYPNSKFIPNIGPTCYIKSSELDQTINSDIVKII